jgi:hypothetical protein
MKSPAPGEGEPASDNSAADADKNRLAKKKTLNKQPVFIVLYAV